ncbi:hypothetical protein [Microvirga calopogonii]|uniref:hypothetical protein n=1 Tax=Microvirga calopogonii TaxID=2078013 RepID=UPI0013B39D32|nr:hypothetical protein [Microvirga calopogonii]
MAKLHHCAIGVLLSLMSFPGSVLADECGDILRANLIERFEKKTDRSYANAERYWACNASLQEARSYLAKQESQTDSGGGSVNYGLFGASGEGSSVTASSLTQSQLSVWQQKNCSDVSSDRSEKAFEFYAQSTVASGVVSAWKACILRKENLSCWASPYGKAILFTMNWRSMDAELPTVRSSSVSSEGASSELIEKGQQVLLNQSQYKIDRNEGRDYLIEISLTHRGRYSYSCFAFIPALKDIKPVAPIESVRIQPRYEPDPNAAQFYPARTITFVVAEAPGGKLDSMMRPTVRALQLRGISATVQNVVGANGANAVKVVSESPPDGYTVLAHAGTASTAGLKAVSSSIYVPVQVPDEIVRKLKPALDRAFTAVAIGQVR